MVVLLQSDVVAMVTSGGHRQWQQWEGPCPGTRHYNNKGNLKVNRRADGLKTSNAIHRATLKQERIQSHFTLISAVVMQGNDT